VDEKYIKRGVFKIAVRPPLARNSVDAVIVMIAKALGANPFDETISVFMNRMKEIAAAGEGTEAVVLEIAGGGRLRPALS